MIDLLIAAGTGAVFGAVATGAYTPNNRLFGPVIGWGSRRQPYLYLTFDDGPNPDATERILDVLAAHEVPATFFMVGDHVARFPHIAWRVAQAGHEIGNHTQHHLKLHYRGPARIRAELLAAHQSIIAATGRLPRVFRAPHGYRNPFVTAAARAFRYEVVGWSYGVWDSSRPAPELIRQRVRAKLTPGAIILLHDGDGYDPHGDRCPTVAALPHIIRDATNAGYEFRSLTDLLS